MWISAWAHLRLVGDEINIYTHTYLYSIDIHIYTYLYLSISGSVHGPTCALSVKIGTSVAKNEFEKPCAIPCKEDTFSTPAFPHSFT
jgi:hypothetical protein